MFRSDGSSVVCKFLRPDLIIDQSSKADNLPGIRVGIQSLNSLAEGLRFWQFDTGTCKVYHCS